ncbi:MAG: phosphotransferase, partial [Eubacterium sp.]|nr:phosphotransferase [Eubacterium sp.]
MNQRRIAITEFCKILGIEPVIKEYPIEFLEGGQRKEYIFRDYSIPSDLLLSLASGQIINTVKLDDQGQIDDLLEFIKALNNLDEKQNKSTEIEIIRRLSYRILEGNKDKTSYFNNFDTNIKLITSIIFPEHSIFRDTLIEEVFSKNDVTFAEYNGVESGKYFGSPAEVEIMEEFRHVISELDSYEKQQLFLWLIDWGGNKNAMPEKLEFYEIFSQKDLASLRPSFYALNYEERTAIIRELLAKNNGVIFDRSDRKWDDVKISDPVIKSLWSENKPSVVKFLDAYKKHWMKNASFVDKMKYRFAKKQSKPLVLYRGFKKEMQEDDKDNDYSFYERLLGYEMFVENFAETMIGDLFGKNSADIKEMLKIKLENHNEERQIQFISDLIEAGISEKNRQAGETERKGNLIVAIGNASGPVMVKLLQILSNNKEFEKMKKDGKIINEIVSSVKSSNAPLSKRVIFGILANAKVDISNIESIGGNLGSGSIGLVYTVKFKTPIVMSDGEKRSEVIVKITRPTATNNQSDDFDVFDKLRAYWLNKHENASIPTREQLEKSLNDELKLADETRVTIEFAENMRAAGTELNIAVPAVASQPGSEHLMYQEKIKGKPLDKAELLEDQRISAYERILKMFFKSVVSGLFHADLHEGNIFVDPDGNRITLIDFGGYGEVGDEAKSKLLIEIFMAIVHGDSKKLLEALSEYDNSLGERLRTDGKFVSDVKKAVRGIPLIGVNKKFNDLFFALNKDGNIDHNLLMFFQALSKIGKYFDYLGSNVKKLEMINYIRNLNAGENAAQDFGIETGEAASPDDYENNRLELKPVSDFADKIGLIADGNLVQRILRAVFVGIIEAPFSILPFFVKMHYGRAGPSQEDKQSGAYKSRVTGNILIKASTAAGIAISIALSLSSPLAFLLPLALNITAHAIYNLVSYSRAKNHGLINEAKRIADDNIRHIQNIEADIAALSNKDNLTENEESELANLIGVKSKFDSLNNAKSIYILNGKVFINEALFSKNPLWIQSFMLDFNYAHLKISTKLKNHPKILNLLEKIGITAFISTVAMLLPSFNVKRNVFFRDVLKTWSLLFIPMALNIIFNPTAIFGVFWIFIYITPIASIMLAVYIFKESKEQSESDSHAVEIKSMPENSRYLRQTTSIPVYTEPWYVIKQTLEYAIAARDRYNAVAGEGYGNIVVSDDGLMVFANNDIEGTLMIVEEKLSSGMELSENEMEVYSRINFYREHDIGVVARPMHKTEYSWGVFQRKGFFKKGSNLNHTLLISELLENFTGDTDYGSALGLVKETVIDGKPIFSQTYISGNVVLGDVLLQLDKDSIVPKNGISATMTEFVLDDSLAYTQNFTVVSNTDETPTTSLLSDDISTMWTYGLPVYSKNGFPRFFGHNGFIRKKALRQVGYWSESDVAEDVALIMKMVVENEPESGKKYHGKYVHYNHLSLEELADMDDSALLEYADANGITIENTDYTYEEIAKRLALFGCSLKQLNALYGGLQIGRSNPMQTLNIIFGIYTEITMSFGEGVPERPVAVIQQMNKFGFGSTQLWLNPVKNWIKYGVFTESYRNFIKDKRISFSAKIDLTIGLIKFLHPVMVVVSTFISLAIVLLFPQVLPSGIIPVVVISSLAENMPNIAYLFKNNKAHKQSIKTFLSRVVFYGGVIPHSILGVLYILFGVNKTFNATQVGFDDNKKFTDVIGDIFKTLRIQFTAMFVYLGSVLAIVTAHSLFSSPLLSVSRIIIGLGLWLSISSIITPIAFEPNILNKLLRKGRQSEPELSETTTAEDQAEDAHVSPDVPVVVTDSSTSDLGRIAADNALNTANPAQSAKTAQKIAVRLVSSKEREALKSEEIKLEENLVIAESIEQAMALKSQGFNVAVIDGIEMSGITFGGIVLTDAEDRKIGKAKVSEDESGIIHFEIRSRNGNVSLEEVKASIEKTVSEGMAYDMLKSKGIVRVVAAENAQTFQDVLGRMRNIERDRRNRKTKEAVLYINGRNISGSFETFCSENYKINNIGVYVIDAVQKQNNEEAISRLQEKGVRFVVLKPAEEVSESMGFELDGAMIDAQGASGFDEMVELMRKLQAAKSRAKNGMDLRITVKFNEETIEKLINGEGDFGKFNKKEYEGIMMAAGIGLIGNAAGKKLGKIEVIVDGLIEDKLLEDVNILAIGAEREEVFQNQITVGQRESAKSVKEKFEQGEKAAWGNKFDDIADIFALEEIITTLTPEDENLKAKIDEFAGRANNGLSTEA